MTSVISASIERSVSSVFTHANDVLAVEEPLEIRLTFMMGPERVERNLSVTMRTPGNDKELATGFLFTEGIIKKFNEVKSIDHYQENIIRIELNNDVEFDFKKLERHFYTTSSCGVCGKTSIEAIKLVSGPRRQNKITYKSSLIYELPEILRKYQSVFEQTGGLHASAVFNPEGKLLISKEDVGRHNALDKLIGAAIIDDLLPLDNHLLLLSGRASFELLQKATMAGIPIVAAVGAPSSLAVELAKERGITLIGFLRENRFNVYCGRKNIE